MKNKPWLGWVMFGVTMLIVFMLGLLVNSVMERRTEALFVNKVLTPVGEFESRNEVWGENYPREFQTYYETADTTFVSKYGGGKMRDMLHEDPRMVVLWAGYGFAKDYNQGRGHFYALEDIYNTLRTGAPKGPQDGPQPSSCWVCKSPDVPRMMDKLGIDEFYKQTWAALGPEIVNPIGCADCHDSKTMNLKITRPALIEAFKEQGKDITKATQNEMRSLVCAQCHVEYYFDKKSVEGATKVKFPWKNGMKAEDMEKYYDDIEFSDFTHALSKAPIIKAQHPDYEIHQMGIHGQRGVSCADCHMPYKSEGGQKFTDHKIQSPLNNVANSCQVCHREEEKTLIANVNERQEKIHQIRIELEDQLVKAHLEAKLAWDKGATDVQMKNILKLIRQAQWRWDFAAASHGGSFHAPLETARIITNGLNKAAEARIGLSKVLAALGQTGPIQYPDISTKEKAQQFIGLDMSKERADKAEFKKTVLPKWLEEAKKK
ncbi:ammonia-forming cytochrome c nitrite reductase [Flavobacterium sp. YO12]|uniref:ammonia-forming cytochrome c nitrite reductase n=1 Tax=Flavobacterium sp. YO12 TaxID=1920029 RepID=UPI0019D6FB9F|nr:ammonia-forming cytochrome c nitrite reductase [Flavobacterium sp. YO12]